MKKSFQLIFQPSFFIGVLLSFSLLPACQMIEEKEAFINVDNPYLLHQSQEKLTDIIVHDIFSPPVASRIYAYANIAAYEALRHGHPEYRSLVGQLNGLNELPEPDATKTYNFSIAGLHSFLLIAKALTFSEDKMEAYMKNLNDSVFKAVPKPVYTNSMEYGEAMAKAVLAWANTDGYKETRGLKYTVLNEDGKWAPTPPAYMDAIEPYWNRIRPFVMDSASQFMPKKPFEFSVKEGSPFYEETMEVYEVGKNLTKEQRAIASFWDCNPFVMHTVGHVMYATKKITPGGHWLGITSAASKKINADMMRSLEAYTLVAIALSDGFVSCWDEKFRSNVIRPETVINAHIDPNWKPLLQTPPFPEYPSGHSVISTAAAVTLTHIYGDNFAFIDSSEFKYGLPIRDFDSFNQAAAEAAISRLYGGIHYMAAIKNGVDEGRNVGNLVVDRIETRKDPKAEMISAAGEQ